MRRVLAAYDPDRPNLVGSVAQAGFYGGAGWAMSRAAVKAFVKGYKAYMGTAMSNIEKDFVYDDVLMPEWMRKHADAMFKNNRSFNVDPLNPDAALHPASFH